ncbi:MAG TPA: maleylpyruvate isomerase family mycothiol-dependent enzyme [Egibacteraceae bacterium]|nr:maleylpyruvate isomerase family mycothiol-dependent enzyme [Egibacteraceae bacterium]
MAHRFAENAAFAQECATIEETLRAVPADAWGRPALGEWDLSQLVAHLVRGAGRVPAYLGQPVDGEPGVDRVEYWRFDADAESPGVAQRAIDEAAGVDPATWPQRFADTWPAAVAAADEAGPDRILTTFRGPMRLDEYVATRVLEVVVHHMDVRAALDLPPVATPAAARLTMAMLEGLLGEPRPRNMGRTRFIQAGTGRISVDDPRFPLLR